jgi:hypothetical protein
VVANPEAVRVQRCLGPVFGLFIGIALGAARHFFLPSDKPVFEVLARSVELAFGILGWAVGIVIVQNKKLHCGGTEPLDDKSRARLALLILASIVLFAVALTLVINGQVIWCSVVLLVFFTAAVGEIGWGKPLKILESVL